MCPVTIFAWRFRLEPVRLKIHVADTIVVPRIASPASG